MAAVPNEDGMVEVFRDPVEANSYFQFGSWRGVLIPGNTYYISGNFVCVNHGGHPGPIRLKARAIGKFVYIPDITLLAFRISKLRVATPHPENYQPDFEFDGNAEYMDVPYNVRSGRAGNNIHNYNYVDNDSDLHVYLPPEHGVLTAAQESSLAVENIAKKNHFEDQTRQSIFRQELTPIFPKLSSTKINSLTLAQKSWLIERKLQGMSFSDIRTSILSSTHNDFPASDIDWLEIGADSRTQTVKKDDFKELMDRFAKGGRSRRRPTAGRRRRRKSAKMQRQYRTHSKRTRRK